MLEPLAIPPFQQRLTAGPETQRAAEAGEGHGEAGHRINFV